MAVVEAEAAAGADATGSPAAASELCSFHFILCLQATPRVYLFTRRVERARGAYFFSGLPTFCSTDATAAASRPVRSA